MICRSVSQRGMPLTDLLRPDLCVIGGGAAGLAVATTAAAFGVPVVLLEHRTMGGRRLNGGVARLALLAAAERAHAVRTAGRFGIHAGEPAIDFRAVMSHVRNAVGTMAPNDSPQRLRGIGITVIADRARFTGPREVSAGDTTIRARRYVLATGSEPAIPAIPGLDAVPFLTPDSITGLAELPGRLVVLGGTPAAIELAQAFRRLGAESAVVAEGHLLPGLDREAAEMVATALKREGVIIHTHTAVSRIGRDPATGMIELALASAETGPAGAVPAEAAVMATHLLVATGDTPCIADLGLDAAGIKADADGITIDRGFRTRNRRVYAIGGCAGGPHASPRDACSGAADAAPVVRSILFRIPARARPSDIVRIVRSDPEVASVGLGEAEAGARGAVRILRGSLADNDSAVAEGARSGAIKVVADRRGRVLGATLACRHAGELVTPWAMAVAEKRTLARMADLPAPDTTYAGLSKRAAISYFLPNVNNPWLRVLIRILKLLG